eukprot:403345161
MNILVVLSIAVIQVTMAHSIYESPRRFLSERRFKAFSQNKQLNMGEKTLELMGCLTSLETWITDLKHDKAYQDLPFKSLILPGAHHAGLQQVKASPQYKAALFTAFMNGGDISGIPQQLQDNFINLISITQVLSLDQLLKSGVRYLDMRLTGDLSNGNIVLSHLFLSDHKASDFLETLNTFMTNNPGEIVILHVRDEFQSDFTRPGFNVTKAQIEALITNYIDETFILDSSQVDSPIKDIQGGIFLTGDFPLDTILDTIQFTDPWPITFASTPQSVIDNIFTYLNNEVKQDSIDGVSRVDPYVTLTNLEIATSLNFYLSYPSPGQYTQAQLDVLDPGNLLRKADISNKLFLDSVKSQVKDYSILNIINSDKITPEVSIQIINLNQELRGLIGQ